MENLHKTEQELEIDFTHPLGEQDPIIKLNDHARKKRKHANEPCLEIFFRLHQGPGKDDHARTFSSFLLAEVDKRNLNPLKQIRAIEQLRQ
ncbi:hypothetical protein Tco_0731316 [Tanacetum coccineum]